MADRRSWSRRQVLRTGIAGLAGATLSTHAHGAPTDGESFGAGTVAHLAQELSRKPFVAQDVSLPPALANLDYDSYRRIVFNREKALWRNEGLFFQLQFFHRGSTNAGRVDVAEVIDGCARPIRYEQSLFEFGGEKPPHLHDLGFAGFKVLAPLNASDRYDEVAAFLGASYFRAVAAGEVYGLSARGLSVRSGESDETFPVFRRFWIEKPAPEARMLIVHALLDGKSATGAFRFTIEPGAPTTMDVDAVLFPRVDLDKVGIAANTSMFWFGPADRKDVDDFRPTVHDSGGLAISGDGHGDLWRVLENPRTIQWSAFSERRLRGFGLLQRDRVFRDYEDLESRFERRPSLWVEPKGDWGRGDVILVELPTRDEYNDNIVAFWRPAAPLKAGEPYRCSYCLSWGDIDRYQPGLAHFALTRAGRASDGTRLFVLHVVGQPARSIDLTTLVPEVTSEAGTVRNIVLQRNDVAGGLRLSFEFVPGSAASTDLRARILASGTPMTENWLYRWST